MEDARDNLSELESKLIDPLHKNLIKWYRENPSEEQLTAKLIKLIQDNKNEIEKS